MIARPSTVARLVGAFVPRAWPTRPRMLELAQALDAQHGPAAVGVVLRGWHSWHTTRTLPAGAAGELLLGLREVVTGGLGPRPMPHSRAIA